jgi:Fic family protein
MTIAEKLRAIKTISRLSQEKLAREFNVSFATFNSWINGKSQPRPKAKERIETLYLEYTGQRLVPPDVLTAKKQALIEKQKTHPRVLKYILENPDIHDQFILSLTYHTNRIEGSTLTEPETASILFQNAALPDKNLIEHLEVKNHQTALQFLLNHFLSGSGQIDEEWVLSLHRMLMNSIRSDAGLYRKHSVRIVGADTPTANYVKIPSMMKQLVDTINTQVEDSISHIAEVHSRFEQIHPFSDGNGRIGRLLIHAMALRRGLPPAVIRQEKKQFYYSYLNKAQQTLHKDLSLLEDFICDALLEGYRILERE